MSTVALLIVTWLLFLPRWMGAGIPPAFALMVSFQLAFFAALFIGARLTADAFSQEYRDKTLPLLMLSRLRGWEIALGKLTSNGVTALYMLMATLPILSIPLIAGGATGSTILRLSLATLSGLVFSASIGLFFSSLTESGRRAWALSLTTLLALLFGPQLLLAFLSVVFRVNALTQYEWLIYLHFFSPASLSASAMQVMGFAPASSHGGFWIMLVIQQGIAWSLVLVSGLVAARRSVDRPEGVLRVGLRGRLRLWRLGDSPTRARRRQVMDLNPFMWLVTRYGYRAAWPLALTLLPITSAAALWYAFPRVIDPVVTGFVVCTIIHLILKFQVGAESVAPILTERRSGTIELLMSTPISNRQLMQGQARALRSQFAPALTVAVAATLAQALLVILHVNDPETRLWGVIICSAAALALLIDTRTMVWVGMWCATWKINERRAAGTTTAFVVVFPWLILILLSLGMAVLAAAQTPRSFEPSPWLFFGAWVFLGFGIDIFWLVLTQRILSRRLRALLSKPLSAHD